MQKAESRRQSRFCSCDVVEKEAVEEAEEEEEAVEAAEEEVLAVVVAVAEKEEASQLRSCGAPCV